MSVWRPRVQLSLGPVTLRAWGGEARPAGVSLISVGAYRNTCTGHEETRARAQIRWRASLQLWEGICAGSSRHRHAAVGKVGATHVADGKVGVVFVCDFDHVDHSVRGIRGHEHARLRTRGGFAHTGREAVSAAGPGRRPLNIGECHLTTSERTSGASRRSCTSTNPVGSSRPLEKSKLRIPCACCVRSVGKAEENEVKQQRGSSSGAVDRACARGLSSSSAPSPAV